MKILQDIQKVKDVIGYVINKNEYENAYLELYELIKRMPLKDRVKIPNDFIDFLKDNMNSNYNFKYDESKNLLNQDIMVETKALLVQLYEKYLSKPEEREFWNTYNIECMKISEDNNT